MIITRIVHTLIGIVGATLINLLGPSLSIQITGKENLQKVRQDGQNVLYAFWHEGLLVATYCFRNQGIRVLISQHKDGEFIARAIEHLGYCTVRGSSTRGGTRALFRMISAAQGGDDLGITVDGPRGPRLHVKPGVLLIAARSGIPIVPFAVASCRSINLSSWDRFQIPIPFSKAVVAVGKPLSIPSGADIEQYRLLLENQLLQVQNVAENNLY